MCVPSGARHEIVKVVAVVIGTVEAPPESDVCEKLPSGDVSVHSLTPCVFQKIDVREPRFTFAGTAQMSTFGSTVLVVVATGFVVVATGFAGVCETVTCGDSVICCGAPTW